MVHTQQKHSQIVEIYSFLFVQHKGSEPVFPLDMAPNSVDDDYNGCSDKMSKNVTSSYLPNEKYLFLEAWEKATIETQGMNPTLDNLNMNHAIAIRAYSYHTPNIHTCLGMAVRSMKNSYQSFMYHSLHFLLTDAIQRLNPNHSCQQVYRGSKSKFKLSLIHKLLYIRFGTFTSTSLYPMNTTRFGTTSCFEIQTCHGALISKYSKYSDSENEVLIPPYEKFKIVKVVTKPAEQKTMKCDTVYQLKSSGVKSNLRCALFQKARTLDSIFYK